MFCENCGKKIRASAKFCPYCGSLNEHYVPEDEDEQPEQQADPASTQPEMNTETPTTDAPVEPGVETQSDETENNTPKEEKIPDQPEEKTEKIVEPEPQPDIVSKEVSKEPDIENDTIEAKPDESGQPSQEAPHLQKPAVQANVTDMHTETEEEPVQEASGDGKNKDSAEQAAPPEPPKSPEPPKQAEEKPTDTAAQPEVNGKAEKVEQSSAGRPEQKSATGKDNAIKNFGNDIKKDPHKWILIGVIVVAVIVIIILAVALANRKDEPVATSSSLSYSDEADSDSEDADAVEDESEDLDDELDEIASSVVEDPEDEVPEEDRTPRNGFDGGTTTFTLDNLQIPIPTYFGNLQDTKDGWKAWLIEGSGGDDIRAIVIPGSRDWNGTDSDNVIIKNLTSIMDEDVDMSSVEKQTETIAGYAGGKASFSVTNDQGGLTNVVMIYVKNTDLSKIDQFIMFQSPESKYDYSSDLDKIMAGTTAQKPAESSTSSSASTNSSNAQTSTSSASTDSGAVTPELKEFLDGYEAWVDSYCEFMTEYAKNPTDLTLISKYGDMMKQLNDWSEKVDAYNEKESEMSKADLDYYIDVTTRCTQKMLKAANSISG